MHKLVGVFDKVALVQRNAAVGRLETPSRGATIFVLPILPVLQQLVISK